MKKNSKTKAVKEKKAEASSKWYWKDPEHARALQRAKFKRNPEAIKESNKRWQEKNKEHFKKLVCFNSRIWQERHGKNRPEVIEAIILQKEEYKAQHRAEKAKLQKKSASKTAAKKPAKKSSKR